MTDVLRTDHLLIGYKGEPILPEIGISMAKGELVALAGPNGAGKTTLFKTLTGSIKPIGGSVTLLGEPLASLSPSQRAATLGIVLTEKPDDIFLKVFDIVAAGRYPHLGLMARLGRADKELVEKSLETVGIAHLSDRHFVTLSDGEQQKVMIAKALAQDTPLIFMDEPAAFLDYPSKIELMSLMRSLTQRQGKTILFSSHDLDLLFRYSDKIWIVGHGRPLTEGSPKELAAKGLIDSYFSPIVARREFPYLF